MSPARVKLAAIASDEAAYLADWVFHHLHFGFDSIDVYLNNNSDNTREIRSKLAGVERLRFIDGDHLFEDTPTRGQSLAYRDALDSARRDGSTHLLFLDVDEFWTPLDLESSISTCVASIPADVVSFEWFTTHEAEEFSPAIDRRLVGAKARLVKSVFRIELSVRNVNSHNVDAERASYALADGSAFRFDVRVDSGQLGAPLKPYFVLHRAYRSEMEYVSRLQKRWFHDSAFKSNRPKGFQWEQRPVAVRFAPHLVDRYLDLRNRFLADLGLAEALERARRFVRRRYDEVLASIRGADCEELETLDRVLRGVDLPEVRSAHLELEIRCAPGSGPAGNP